MKRFRYAEGTYTLLIVITNQLIYDRFRVLLFYDKCKYILEGGHMVCLYFGKK